MPKIGDTAHWRDENGEHSAVTRPALPIDKTYRYRHKNPLWCALSWVLHRPVMTPVAFLYTKIRYRHKIVNRRLLRAAYGQGCFLYGNHTPADADPFIPNLIALPKRTYVVVSAENLSNPRTRTFLELNGAIPVPTSLHAHRNFREILEKRTVQNCAVAIWPEADIRPCYTGIRPFSEVSFAYPVRFGEPVYCFTNTFHPRKHARLPRVVTYVDGPFYPDPHLPRREQASALRDQVYATMCERAKLSTYTPEKEVTHETV